MLNDDRVKSFIEVQPDTRFVLKHVVDRQKFAPIYRKLDTTFDVNQGIPHTTPRKVNAQKICSGELIFVADNEVVRISPPHQP